MSFKILDTFKKIDAICAAYFNCRKTVLGLNPVEILDKEELSRIREKIIVAESNILKVIEYDFNVVTPNRLLVERKFVYAAEDKHLLNVAKVLLLDLYRTGCSLLYRPVYLGVASYVLAHFITKGSTHPGAAPKSEEVRSATVNQQADEMHVPGLPPAYFFKMRDFSFEEIKKKLCGTESRKSEKERKSSDEEDHFRAWLEGIESGLSLSQLWEIIDLFCEALAHHL